MQEDLRSEIAKYFWWHSIDLGGGIITRGVKTPAFHQLELAKLFDRVKFSGQSVLDIGAWNGFFSFEAKRRGATRVLATDKYTWSHAYFRGRETFELARRAIGLDVEAMEVDPADIAPENGRRVRHCVVVGGFLSPVRRHRCSRKSSACCKTATYRRDTS